MTQETLYPHSIEAEEALLGSVLIDPDCLPSLVGAVTPEDFYREQHGLVWRCYLDLWRSQVAPDQVTVATSLAERDNLEDAGGMAFLSRLVATTPTSIHARYYAGIVRENSKLRGIIAQAGKMAKEAYGSRPSAEVVEAGIRGLLGLRTGDTDRMPVTAKELYDLHQAELLEELDAGPDYIAGVTTGFSSLDRIINGWKRGLLYILGARTSIGKTTFAAASILKLLEIGFSVYLFTLETTRREMMERIWHGMARVDVQAYRSLPPDSPQREEQRGDLVDAINRFDTFRLTVDDRRGMTPLDIRAALMAYTQGFGTPDLVVIDYLNLVRAQETRRSRYEQVSEVVQALKDVGGEANVPLLLLAQLSREPERRGDQGRRPALADFRDAGTIEEVASCVLGLYRASYYYPTEESWEKAYPGQRYPKNTMEALVLKQQSGPTGMVPLYCEMGSGFMGPMHVSTEVRKA